MTSCLHRSMFVVLLLLGSAAVPLAQPGVVGDWNGTLSVSGIDLRLVFHIVRGADGTLSGTLDSLDQGAMGLAVPIVTVNGNTVRFELKAPAAAFEGTLSEDGNRIDGSWQQGALSMPLVLRRGTVAKPKRPQVPEKPYPYVEEDVTYTNTAAGVRLAGTLTLPKQAAAVPAVVLISGSGAEDRDETVFGHKPFLVLADYLTRNGIAVLRVDDRGVGGSTGSVPNSTSEDFADDTLAGLAYLKGRKEIDPKRIGLVGHSEGGLIAPIAAAKSPDVAFVVLMAGPGLPGDQILYLQGAAISKAMNIPEADIKANRMVQERLLTLLKTEADPAVRKAKLSELKAELLAKVPPAQQQAMTATLEAQFTAVDTPWFRYFVFFDPRPTLAKVKCPVLAITGELDLQVPYAENLAAIEAAVKSGGNDRVTVMHLPGLNHLFQTAKTGAPGEYSQIEETMAPSAMKLIADWILRVK